MLELDNDCSRDVAKAHDGDCDGSGKFLQTIGVANKWGLKKWHMN